MSLMNQDSPVAKNLRWAGGQHFSIHTRAQQPLCRSSAGSEESQSGSSVTTELFRVLEPCTESLDWLTETARPGQQRVGLATLRPRSPSSFD